MFSVRRTQTGRPPPQIPHKGEEVRRLWATLHQQANESIAVFTWLWEEELLQQSKFLSGAEYAVHVLYTKSSGKNRSAYLELPVSELKIVRGTWWPAISTTTTRAQGQYHISPIVYPCDGSLPTTVKFAFIIFLDEVCGEFKPWIHLISHEYLQNFIRC